MGVRPTSFLVAVIALASAGCLHDLWGIEHAHQVQIKGCLAGKIEPTRRYFEPGTLDDDSRVDRLCRCWYSEQLDAMREPVLRVGHAHETVRLLWLRSFAAPIGVRLWREDGKVWLRAVRLTGHGGYAPGKVELARRFNVSDEDWAQVNAKLAAAHFWPNSGARPPRREGATDDDAWVLEAVRGNEHRVLSLGIGDVIGEFQPPQNQAFFQAAMTMLKLAEMDVSGDTLY